MDRQLAIGFVIYAPSPNFLLRLEQVVASGFDSYIFDNSPVGTPVRGYCAREPRVKYLTAGKNLGLGYGLSMICAQAYYEGRKTALLFFDQDTVFTTETLTFIEDYYLEHSDSLSHYSVVGFNATGDPHGGPASCFKEVRLLINSGAMYLLENLQKMGWHNEKYFVDCVDYEFCLRSVMHGFSIGLYTCTPGFDHAVEQADRRFRILGKDRVLRAYPPFRMIDTLKATLRLASFATLSGYFRFSWLMVRHLIIYFGSQLAARVFRPL
jgi:rhamnosyltransferase